LPGSAHVALHPSCSKQPIQHLTLLDLGAFDRTGDRSGLASPCRVQWLLNPASAERSGRNVLRALRAAGTE